MRPAPDRRSSQAYSQESSASRADGVEAMMARDIIENQMATHEGGHGERGAASAISVEGEQGNAGPGPGTSGGNTNKITGFRRIEHRVASMNHDFLSEIGSVKHQLSEIQSTVARLTSNSDRPMHANSDLPSRLKQPGLSNSSRRPFGSTSNQCQDLSISAAIGRRFSTAHEPLTEGFRARALCEPSAFATSTPAASVPTLASTASAPSSIPTHRTSNTAAVAYKCSASDLNHQATSGTASQDNLRFFEIDGEVLQFDPATVPNPPTINFSDDLSRLFREWHHSTLLVINGRGIGVKHWERFYKKRANIKQHAWEVLRVRWGTWKFLVEERERFVSDEAFWAHYSNEHGQPLNYQKIVDILQSGRINADARDAAAALEFFGNDLSRADAHGYFMYKKANKLFVCNKPASVAQKWRQLLRDHPEIAQRWERMATNV
ncbi:hypothetical protein ACG7TL_004084 [Trametes sanguinea]